MTYVSPVELVKYSHVEYDDGEDSTISSCRDHGARNECDQFEDIPIQCVCPHCKERIVTFVNLQSSWGTYILAFSIFILLGWIACCVLPFIYSILQDMVHSCPRCLNEVSRKRRIQVPSFRNEVMTFRCGSCAIVLSRVYVAILAIILVLIALVSITRSMGHKFGSLAALKGASIDKTWHEFLQHCGMRTALGNSLHATYSFRDIFEGKTVDWTGFVHHVVEGNLLSQSSMLIRMDPPQFPHRGVPDLELLLRPEVEAQVAKYKPGDEIKFEATLISLGRRGPHHAILWNSTATGKHKNFDDSAVGMLHFGRNILSNGEVVYLGTHSGTPETESGEEIDDFDEEEYDRRVAAGADPDVVRDSMTEELMDAAEVQQLKEVEQTPWNDAHGRHGHHGRGGGARGRPRKKHRHAKEDVQQAQVIQNPTPSDGQSPPPAAQPSVHRQPVHPETVTQIPNRPNPVPSSPVA